MLFFFSFLYSYDACTQIILHFCSKHKIFVITQLMNSRERILLHRQKSWNAEFCQIFRDKFLNKSNIEYFFDLSITGENIL